MNERNVVRVRQRETEGGHGSELWNLAIPAILDSILLRNHAIVLLCAGKHYSIFKTAF